MNRSRSSPPAEESVAEPAGEPAASGADAPAAPRPTRTARALVEAGKRMMSDGRMDAATLDDIAREADISKRSFHNHFADREALVKRVLEDVRADLEAHIAAVNEGVTDPATRFARGLLMSFRYGLDNRLSERVMLHIAPGVADPDEPRNHALAGYLRAGVASGTFDLPHLDAGVVLVLGLSDLGLSRLLPLRDERQRARALMKDIGVLMLRGLGVDGRRIEAVIEDALQVVVDPRGPLAARSASA